MGAVAVVVHVHGVLAAGRLARAVERLAVLVLGLVGDEVAAELAVEVGGDVGVLAVHAGVDDADEDLAGAGGLGVGAVGADHAHVPLAAGERLAPGLLGEGVLVGERGPSRGCLRGPAGACSGTGGLRGGARFPRTGGFGGTGCFGGAGGVRRGGAGGGVADAAVRGDAGDSRVRAHGLLEPGARAGGHEVAESGVGGDRGATGAFHGGLGLVPLAEVVEDEELGPRRGGVTGRGRRAGAERHHGDQRRQARGDPPHSSPIHRLAAEPESSRQ